MSKKAKEVKSVGGECVAYAVMVSAAAAALIGLSGCGAVTGIRHMDLWGAQFDFAEGIDLHAGTNAIDHVDDRRGVTSGLSYKQGHASESQKY